MDWQVLSDEVLEKVEAALRKGDNWIAYNNSLYFIEPGDVFFFNNRDAADEFAANNVSDHDRYAVMYASSVADVFRKIFYREELYMKEQQLFINKNSNVMNEKNLEHLKDNLKYLGFGEGLNAQLELNIRQEKPDFTLKHQATYNNQTLDSSLHFKKGEQEMYFFNRYEARIQQPEERQQTFYIDRGNGITNKEAFNLLNGRAVHKELTNKEGQPYNAWVQLDLTKKEENGGYKQNRYHENYGYNLAAEIEKLTLKPLGEEQHKQLLASLQKGNLQAATFIIGTNEPKLFIEANPQYKTVNLYDPRMNQFSQEAKKEFQRPAADTTQSQVNNQSPSANLKSQSNNAPSHETKQLNGQEQKDSRKENQKTGSEDGDGPELKKKRTRKKGLAV